MLSLPHDHRSGGIFLICKGERLIFPEHLEDDLLEMVTDVFSCIFIEFIPGDRFAVLDHDPCGFDPRNMIFEYIGSVRDGYGNDRTRSSLRDLEAAVVECMKLKLITVRVAHSFRVNEDRDAFFCHFSGFHDRLYTLPHICAVDEEAAEKFHIP